MTRCAAAVFASLVAIALFFLVSLPPGQQASLGIPAAKAGTGDAKPLNPCAPPGSVSANITKTAWQLWVAATCPVNGTQYPFVVWQNWIEQAQQYPTDPSLGLEVPNAKASATPDLHVLHSSPLTLVKNPSLLTLNSWTAWRRGSKLQQGRHAARGPAQSRHLRGGPAERGSIRLYRGNKSLEPPGPSQRRDASNRYPIQRCLRRNQIRLDQIKHDPGTEWHRARLRQPSQRFRPENSRRSHPWQLLWTGRYASDFKTVGPVDMGDL